MVPAVAAIRQGPKAASLLASFAHDLSGTGTVVRGLIQKPGGKLVDVASGRSYPILQNLGPGSKSCRVDPRGMAEASQTLRDAVTLGADLVVVNRFGKLEAHGQGLADEMLAVMVAGIPLLTVLNVEHLARWLDFTGGAGTLLMPERDSLDRWWAQVRKTG
jgi:nucleoside-triphosphatase THEP1